MGIIIGFKTKINTSILNFTPCFALINLGYCTNADLQKLLTYCIYKTGIHYVVHQIGKYELELTMDIKNIIEFYRIVDEIRIQFAFVKNITTLIAKP